MSPPRIRFHDGLAGSARFDPRRRWVLAANNLLDHVDQRDGVLGQLRACPRWRVFRRARLHADLLEAAGVLSMTRDLEQASWAEFLMRDPNAAVRYADERRRVIVEGRV